MIKLYKVMREFTLRMKRLNISAFAASTAFFIFVSFVPMLVMICTIIPFTPLTEENLVSAITDITPDVIDNIMVGLISDVYDKSAGILSIAVIATLWTAGKGFLALTQGLNAINEVEEKRNYFTLRITSSFYTLVMLVMVVLSLLVMVFGRQLMYIVLRRFPAFRRIVYMVADLRFLFIIALLTLFFTMLYTYVPSKKLSFKEQIPGAVFAAAAWSIFSWGFSIYVYYFNYSIYGSLSIIVIVMLWMYFCMYIIMIGAHINSYFNPVTRALLNTSKSRN